MSPKPIVDRETSQYAHRPSCDCVDCQDARRIARNPDLYENHPHDAAHRYDPECGCRQCEATEMDTIEFVRNHYGYGDKPGANIPIRAYVIGLALSAVIILVGFAILWSVPGYAREGAIRPVAAPASLTRARAACPTDSIPCLHGKLRRAYESIAWQRSARQHAQAMTVQDITRDAIAWAAAKYHVSAADMTSVGICESHLWPFATNGQYAGAWQLSARHREDPIFNQVPWQDAYAEASHVARYVKAHGWGEWQCQPGGGLRW